MRLTVFYNHLLLQLRGCKTIQKEYAVMKAADVMVSNVITVNVNATIGEVATTLLNNHISAAPVVDEEGGLVGIVSEGDLMRRPEISTTRRHSWWLELISTGWASANEYIKSPFRQGRRCDDSQRCYSQA
jgi:CBS-domain-containing membrane protein